MSIKKNTLSNNNAVTKLVSISIAILISFSILFILIYQMLIPELITDQIRLRAQSITAFFADAVLEHVVARDYLTINRLTEKVSALPDVGYACVIDDKADTIAGIFSNLNVFDTTLNAEIKNVGFPSNVISSIHLIENKNHAETSLQIGGRNLVDYALRIENANAEVHVGIFTESAIQNSQNSSIPHAFLLFITAVFGIITFIWILRTA